VLTKRAGGVRGREALALAVVAAAACAAWAPAESAGESQASSLIDVAKDPASVRDYWTPERMRDAIPLRPASTSAQASKRGGGRARRVRHVKRSPERRHGKVFLTLGAADYVCSGTSVRSPSDRFVWTAGHCVGDPNLAGTGCSYVSNWTFVPAYRNGHAPFGEWPATAVGGAPGWCKQGGLCSLGALDCDFRFDLGAARVATNGRGRTLAQVVGTRGIAFNLSRSRTYRGFGYPAAGRFSGERMYRCRSGHAGDDHAFGSPATLKFNCNMTSGSSGGSWVVSGGRVASVVSYGVVGDNRHLYGPYQGSAAKRFYHAVN